MGERKKSRQEVKQKKEKRDRERQAKDVREGWEEKGREGAKGQLCWQVEVS